MEMFSTFHRRPLVLLSSVSLVISATVTALAASSSTVDAARSRAVKYAVCHRTNAIKNPYRLINVAWSSVDPNNTGHDNPVHDGPVFNVSDPVASHGSTPRDSGLGSEVGGGNDRWGDIFYAEKVLNQNNSTINSNNWTTEGQAIFNGATFTINGVSKRACRAMSANDFIKAEKEENPNRRMSDIMADLDDQGAAEDAALKTSLGGSFSTWYNNNGGGSEDPNVIASKIDAESPAVTTEPPTNLVPPATGATDGTATLQGTISPSGASMIWYFEWSSNVNWRNDPSSVTPNETSPSSAVSTSQNVSTGITGLSNDTIYYYRTVGVVSTGTGDDQVETYLYGVIKQFVFGAPSAPVLNSLTCGNTKLTVAFTSNATVTNVTGYEYSVDGGPYVNSGIDGTLLASSTSATFEITGLQNGVQVLVALRAITATKVGLDSVALSGSACGAPTPVTDPATQVQEQTATINGTVTSNGAPTTVTFTWGTDPQLGGSPTTTSATPGQLGPAEVLPVLLNLTGLTGGTTYYFRVNANNTGGSGSGVILSFTTPAPPSPTSGGTPTVPTPTTTVPPAASPTTVAPASNNEIGRVIGTAWFDGNKNNKRDNDEPLLASLPIELIPTGVTAQDFNKVRKTALSLTTGSDGSFDFTSVPPGTYRILGDLPSGYGIDKSWDSSGNNDWTVNVTVVAAKVARGDFAAVGDAAMEGCYSGRIEATQLTATWDGFDKKLGTVDDATFTSKIGTDCSFELAGVPTGKFEVAAKNSTGKVVTKTTMEVSSSGGTVKTASLSVKAKIQKVLPQTGSRQMSDLMVLAMYALVTGTAIVMTSRRRRRLA